MCEETPPIIRLKSKDGKIRCNNNSYKLHWCFV